MFSFKNILFLLLLLLGGCRAARYTFDRNSIISKDVQDDIAAIVTSGPPDPVLDARVYRAEIRERLVNENSITEYSLRNTLSEKPHVDIEVQRYHHEMYYYEFLTRDSLRYGLLMTASFENGRCISIGPVYVGEVGIKRSSGGRYFLASGQLRIKKDKGSTVPALDSKVSGSKKLRMNYQFVGADSSQIRFIQIINELPNKISGLNKKLVYDIPQVFNDSNALSFRRIAN